MSSDDRRRDLCPIDDDTQQWIDARVSWIVYQFGWDQIRSCKAVVPTAEFFPAPFRGSEADAQVMLEQLCPYLGIDLQTVELAFFYEGARADGGPTAAGVYEEKDNRFRIWIEYSELHNPSQLAATIVHELCHVHLLGQRRIAADEDDHEPLTDLLAIFLGLGVLLSNSILQDTTAREGHLEFWRIHRRGYLTMPMCGYALALFSKIRGEHDPDWVVYLRPDVRDAFRKSLTYLQHHGLPEFRTLITTSARPTLYRTEEVEEDCEPDQDEENDRHESGEVARCHYCGVALDDANSTGVCEDCRTSVAENQQEIEVDRRRQEEQSRTKQIVLRCGCLFVVATFLLLALLDWLDILG